MEIKNYIHIDFTRGKDIVVPSIQYDSGTRWVMAKLYDNGLPIDLQELKVCIMAVKSNGKEVFNECKIIDAEKGIIEFEITKQMGILVGEVECQIKLFGPDQLLSSNIFKLSVTKTLSPSSESSKDELDVLVNALGQVQDIDNRFAQTNAQLSETNYKIDEIKQNSQEKIREIESELAQTNTQLSETSNRIGLTKSILEYKHLKTFENKKEDWSNAIQQAIEDISTQQVIKVVFPYGTYRITKPILLGANYMINFEGEHSAFSGEAMPDRTLASTIYLDVEDSDTPMFTSKDGTFTQIGGQITNMGFMCYTNSFYGKPKNIFMKNLRCAFRGFHLDRCLVAQFKYVWYDCSLGGGTLIKNNQIRGIGKAVCSNTIIGDAQIFHNYFNGFMNDDGEQIYYPDFIDKDRTQTTFSLAQINDNWFEFFRYVFVRPTKMQFTGNLFDYCCRILDNAGFNIVFDGNILSNSTKHLITNSIQGRGRVNKMFDNESYVNLNIWGSGVSITNNTFTYPLDNQQDTYFMEIEGHNQTGKIKNIKMIGNNGGEFKLHPKFLLKNSNRSYVRDNDNLINLELLDYNNSFSNVSELSEIFPNLVMKNNRFFFSERKKYFTALFSNTDASREPLTYLQLFDDNGYPYFYANDNLVPKFTNESWVKGGRLTFVMREDDFIQSESNNTGNVDLKVTIPVTKGMYRFNYQPSSEGVDYSIALRPKNNSNSTTRSIYPSNSKNKSNELFFFIYEEEVSLEITLSYASTTIGDKCTFIRPSITMMTDSPTRSILSGESYSGYKSLYAIKIKNGKLDCEEFFA